MSRWEEVSGKLEAEFKFKDFAEAWAFMTEVAINAEKQAHHPEWTNIYSTVRIALCTHDDGNVITEKDRKLAKTIDLIHTKFV